MSMSTGEKKEKVDMAIMDPWICPVKAIGYCGGIPSKVGKYLPGSGISSKAGGRVFAGQWYNEQGGGVSARRWDIQQGGAAEGIIQNLPVDFREEWYALGANWARVNVRVVGVDANHSKIVANNKLVEDIQKYVHLEKSDNIPFG
ncbi:hypothetical protein C8R43DRAFT_952106 [Mycena crocata]|nr:hypothetical protein C8R43DRAFT_952106 [Mycena crocata]